MFCMSQITLSVIHSEISRINFSNLDCFTRNSECVDVLRLILLSTKKMLKIIIYDENENNIIIPKDTYLIFEIDIILTKKYLHSSIIPMF